MPEEVKRKTVPLRDTYYSEKEKEIHDFFSSVYSSGFALFDKDRSINAEGYKSINGAVTYGSEEYLSLDKKHKTRVIEVFAGAPLVLEEKDDLYYCDQNVGYGVGQSMKASKDSWVKMTRYSYKGNPWKRSPELYIRDGRMVWNDRLDFDKAIRLGIVNGISKRGVASKSHYDAFDTKSDKTLADVSIDYAHYAFRFRRRDEDTSVEPPIFFDLKYSRDFIYATSAQGMYETMDSGSFSPFRLMWTLPKNEASEKVMRHMADILSNAPVVGNDVRYLFGGPGLNFGGLSANEYENVGNHMPEDIEQVPVRIALGDKYGDGQNHSPESIFDNVRADYMFSFAKINPKIIFSSGAISNCKSMFKGTRGTTTDPKRKQYEVYFSPCKLEVDLEGKEVSGVYPYLGFVPTVIAECFKWSYLNQKSYDAFFLNADMRHCRDFADAFSEQVFNRVFNAEEDGFAPEMVGHGSYGDYGKITIKCPRKAKTPKDQWNDSMLTVWTPGNYDYDTKDRRWTSDMYVGSIALMCKYSHVAAIEPILDLKFMTAKGLNQAFHNPPGQIAWPGYRGLRSQIQEVRIRNLGNMDINFAGEVTDWATTNTPDWNVESMSDASVVFMLNNMRDQSPYQPGKEDELFLLGAHYKLRIPKTWERLLTGPMISDLVRKGWILYIGDEEKSINDCIVCAEEDV